MQNGLLFRLLLFIPNSEAAMKAQPDYLKNVCAGELSRRTVPLRKGNKSLS
jgi:hypothetical protein